MPQSFINGSAVLDGDPIRFEGGLPDSEGMFLSQRGFAALDIAVDTGG